MNGKFIEKYGNAWAELDNDMKMMAIMSEIYDLRESVEPFKKTCKVVERHSIYWGVAIFVIIALAGATITKLIGLF